MRCYTVWNTPLVCSSPLSWCVPFQSFIHPQATCWTRGRGRETEWETEKASLLCKQCSAAAKTLMCYQRCVDPRCKPSTVQTAVKKCNSVPISTLATTPCSQQGSPVLGIALQMCLTRLCRGEESPPLTHWQQCSCSSPGCFWLLLLQGHIAGPLSAFC